MAYTPIKRPKLPRFKCDDSGLEQALNAIADAVDAIEIPDVSMPVEGTTEWNGEQVILRPDQFRKATFPPFWPILFPDGATGHKVSLLRGVVCLRDLTMGEEEESIFYIDPPNRVDENDFPIKFKIEVDEAIFVKVWEDDYGTVATPEGETGSPVTVVVKDKATKSFNRYPISETASVGGETYYKIAELVDEGTGPKLKRYLAGSNIFHTTGLTADVMLESCYVEGVSTPEMISRMSFVSGHLVKVDATEEERPLAKTVSRHSVAGCCEVGY